jgi:CheY-like chemotaxis protein
LREQIVETAVLLYRKGPQMEEVRRRIPIVDDDKVIRELLTELLRSDYELAEAGSGEEALEKLPVFAPD